MTATVCSADIIDIGAGLPSKSDVLNTAALVFVAVSTATTAQIERLKAKRFSFFFTRLTLHSSRSGSLGKHHLVSS